jgi:TIR domain
MTTSAAASASRIFVSYRREDAAYPAGWLFDRLVEHFGADQIFKDVDSIELGDDFVERITAAVGSSAVVLTVIGKRWLTVTGEKRQRRLDDPEDFVRLEIEAAFERGVRVIPVLVDGARMPQVAELPDSLAHLAHRQALELSPNRFGSDTARLLEVLDRTLNEIGVGPAGPLAGTGRPLGRGASYRGTHAEAHRIRDEARSPQPEPPFMVVQRKPDVGARPPAAHRNVAGYGRFWFGLLLIVGGSVCLLAQVPHKLGYGPLLNVANADHYIQAGLVALIVLGILLLGGAAISASRSASAPRGQR